MLSILQYADPPNLPVGGPRIPGCSALEGLHAHFGRLLIETRRSPELANALLLLRLLFWNEAARVRNAGGQPLHTADLHSLQQQVDLCLAQGWPDPQPNLRAVPANTADVFGFAYQPTAAQLAAAVPAQRPPARTAVDAQLASNTAATQPPPPQVPLDFFDEAGGSVDIAADSSSLAAPLADVQLMDMAVDPLTGTHADRPLDDALTPCR